MGKKSLIAVVVLAVAVFVWRSPSEGAALQDGTYLTYETASTSFRLTFSDAGGGKFRTDVEIRTGEGERLDISTEGDGEIVDKRLRTENGTVFELASFGPIWGPPGKVKEGGNANGALVDEVRSWNGWQVGVVKAGAGGGALRGEWYYEQTTGFLVGGFMGTVFSGPDGGQRFGLRDSNLPGLAP